MAWFLLMNTYSFIRTLQFDVGLYGNPAQTLPLNGSNILIFSAFYMRDVNRHTLVCVGSACVKM
jgi:hypothetical protein